MTKIVLWYWSLNGNPISENFCAFDFADLVRQFNSFDQHSVGELIYFDRVFVSKEIGLTSPGGTNSVNIFGREPWSSGYGRKLIRRSWVRTPVPYTGRTWHFFTLICCKKLYCLFGPFFCRNWCKLAKCIVMIYRCVMIRNVYVQCSMTQF